ncbi:putative 60S acidic ribosomal protein P3-like [Capsicum annuum]|nr:putative 60S acidic ribosomal protein P3-like [Capsicum annuum]
MVDSCLADAIIYELWVGSNGTSAHKIYYSDLPWPIGKIMYLKQVHVVKQILGITKENVEIRKEDIYTNANDAFTALSTRSGEQAYFFDNMPTSLDAVFVEHALFTLYVLGASLRVGENSETLGTLTLGGSDDAELELDEDDDSVDYD